MSLTLGSDFLSIGNRLGPMMTDPGYGENYLGPKTNDIGHVASDLGHMSYDIWPRIVTSDMESVSLFTGPVT